MEHSEKYSFESVQRAKAAFDTFRSKREVGEEVDFETFCSQRPEEERAELLSLYTDWLEDQATIDEVPAQRPPAMPGDSLGTAQLEHGSDAQSSLQKVDLAASQASKDTGRAPHEARMEKLSRQKIDTKVRYEVRRELGKGGMGAVYEVWDTDLRRSLAMKVILGDTGGLATNRAAADQALFRFLEEAQITAQLDHPGIVPVHELGVDSDGRVFFTMGRVRGRELKKVFEQARAGEKGWTMTRVLGVMLKVCETMAFAHAKGVVHRDLKPANVMVGRYGAVYVMDWGLASALGHEKEAHDIRLRRDDSVSLTQMETDRKAADRDSTDSPLMTMDGAVLGTPAYMAPEQAKGMIEKVGPLSDIYSVGAMLYQLLTGQTPYVETGTRVSPHTILALVISGPPKPIHELAPKIPAELVAICEKAMAREAADRYQDMNDFAEDLHAYLDQRVVRAYETGAWAELKKWVKRNKALAASVAAAAVLAVVAVGVFIVQQQRVAEEQSRVAEEQQRVSQEQFLAADVFRYQYYVEQAQTLWPAEPHMVGAMDAWIASTEELLSRRGLHEERLGRFRREQFSDEEYAAAAGSGEWAFDDPDEQTKHDSIAGLLDNLAELELEDPEESVLADVRKRRQVAATLYERTIEDYGEEWEEAILSIQDMEESPMYNELVIEPQLGLVPCGWDRDSGLWEFAHVQSGEIPERDDDGKLIITPESALVLVLIPGGKFHMGAVSPQVDASGPNLDPFALSPESPVHEIELDAFFLSKYEMSQAQWRRCTYENPSLYSWDNKPIREFLDSTVPMMHPVELVSWESCDVWLRNYGLTLPTEAQWEYAARAGTSAPYIFGGERDALRGMANVAEGTAAKKAFWPEADDWLSYQDGYAAHAPVTRFGANRFGLHNVLGNVSEWCQDWLVRYLWPGSEILPGTGERILPSGEHERYKITRGGHFRYGVKRARVSYRYWQTVKWVENWAGVRPARLIQDSE